MGLARTKHWSRLEYERLVNLGAFHPEERVELVGGALMVREPQASPHSTAIRAVEEVLRTTLGAGWDIRTQMPIALDDESEPEPDVSVVPGTFRDYTHGHPSRPALLVEVSDSSLSFDRRDKGSLYARARVPEYWIVNLVERVLEVYRESEPEPRAAYGWAYHHRERLEPDQHVAPMIAPGSQIRVADLLP